MKEGVKISEMREIFCAVVNPDLCYDKKRALSIFFAE